MLVPKQTDNKTLTISNEKTELVFTLEDRGFYSIAVYHNKTLIQAAYDIKIYFDRPSISYGSVMVVTLCKFNDHLGIDVLNDKVPWFIIQSIYDNRDTINRIGFTASF